MPLWEDIKGKFERGFSAAAEKTEELRKIGKIKVDIIGIKRSLDSRHQELGKETYTLLSADKKAAPGQNAKVKELVAAIDALNASLSQKEKEIEQIKAEAAAKKAAVTADKPAEPPATKKS